MDILKIFLEMQKIPKGDFIQNPYDKIMTDFILSDTLYTSLNMVKNKIYLTRLTLKHLSEKRDEGLYILEKIGDILRNPDFVYSGKFLNRFLISKMIYLGKGKKHHIVNLEITTESDHIIITVFVARNSYVKNLKLLWRAAPSPSQ
ncbi:MAG: hypothetical protein V4576_02965 [Patescibacteria group bacterium]